MLGLGESGFAQNKTITGRVTDQKDGLALPGVSVLLKGTSTGTATDADGKYSLNVPVAGGTLVFSFIGLLSEEMPIEAQSVINAKMIADVKQLSELVVTAFGLAREKKALGYTVQEVKGSALVEARSSNVANSLNGRIAGVRVNTNAGPGSNSTIQIRGAASVGGNNQPLIVVDGVPIQQSFDKQFGSGLSEVSPDNIKSLSVLKGPNAAALYGSRATNGVILITTKNGSEVNGIGVEINSNVTFERPLVKPGFQNQYGGGNGYRTWYSDGWSGPIGADAVADYQAAYPVSPFFPAPASATTTGTDGTDESWGAPLDGRLVRQWWTGTALAPLTPQPNNWDEFWQTGHTITNNVAVSGSNEKGSFRLSLGRLDQTGIMASNDFHRNNFKLNTGYNFTPKLNVALSAEYVKSGSDNRSYTSGQEFIWSHRHVSWDQLQDWQSYTGVHLNRKGTNGRPDDTDPPNWQHTFFTNPFFLQERLPYSNEKDRLVGNIALTYKILPFLNLMVRSGTDVWTDTRINVFNFERVRNGNRTPGRYSEEVLRRQETNHDAILSFNKEMSGDFSLNGQLGGAIRTNYYKRNFLSVGELVVDGVYNAGNSNPSQNTVESRIEKTEVQSLFGSAQLGFRNALFLDVTARNDWSSTLPASARSYFYPSASLSAVVTELLNVQNSVLSFGKIRASIAQVGSDGDPYQLQQVFRSGGSWNGSVPEFYENTTIANATLKPEITTSQEYGLDVRFLNGRVGLDVTYYTQNTNNQILGVEISKAAGYDKRILNAGKISNKGLEVVLSGTPVKLPNGFAWEVALNFARNRNKVEELAEGLTTYILNERRGLTSEARVGQPYGTLYGIGFERAPDGQLVYRNGLPIVSTAPRILGNLQPDWIGGVMNSLNYKGISLSALIDVRKGGDLYDEGSANARWTGQYAETAVGREEGVIGKGVKNVGTAEAPQYVPNDVIAAANQFYGYNNPRSYHESAIFDATYVKLREVTLGYTFPKAWFRQAFIQSMRISAVGRNLAILFKNTPHIDPEVDANGGNRQGFTYGELPGTRSIGFNVSLSF
ncbi:MAG: SusC/RagA family TonB-linked outer membrane protein [Ferruginibacter sp.]|nr:SusC/RagA family TonB-linked outer membrane protein [Cytophagales bacterium]